MLFLSAPQKTALTTSKEIDLVVNLLREISTKLVLHESGRLRLGKKGRQRLSF